MGAARAPAWAALLGLRLASLCEAGNASAYDGFWTGPGHQMKSTFETEGILIIAAIVVVVAAIIGSVAAWKQVHIEKFINGSFESTGRFVGSYPIPVFLLALLVCIGLSSGMAMQKAESDPSLLWVPDGATALEHADYTKNNWRSSQSFTFVLAVPKEGEVGPNVLNGANLKSMLKTHEALMGIEVDGGQIVEDSKDIEDYTAEYGGTWTYTGAKNGTRAKCSKWGPSCAMRSVIAIFNYDENLIGNQTAIIDRLDRWDKAPRETTVPVLNLFKNFELSDVLGGIKRDANGKVESAEVFMMSMFMTKVENEVKIETGGSMETTIADPVTFLWEAEAVCVLGVQDSNPVDSDKKCSVPAGDLKYTGLLERSFGDEFGNAIRNDIARIGTSYMLIIVYLFCCLGKRDTVHSMLAMSFAVVVAVGLSFSSSQGIGGMFGVKTNPLNNNIPFLLLGLGVDDAFVLVSELTLHMKQNKDMDAANLIALTARTGGSSILITSLTDALAFLVGASTRLPALSGFCIYGGIAVLMCFALQIVFVLPLLALNIRRTKDNRYDCLCCLQSKIEHQVDQPQGCCCCFAPKCTPTDGIMKLVMGKVGDVMVKTMPGKVFTLVVWTTIFAIGIAGMAQIDKDFKLEWFFPEESYVRDFININDEFFSEGTSFNVYTTDIDVCNNKDQLNELASYLKQQDYIKQSSINNWWENFRPDPTVAAASTCPQFYQDLSSWTNSQSGIPYRNSIQWIDTKCNAASTTGCDPTKGVNHTRISATLKRLSSGVLRYNTMSAMRIDIGNIMEDDTQMKAFPFSNDFLYWEENGIIDTEIARNLLIAGGIIFVILCTMIPKPRIAVIVSVGICFSIIELIGFLYWWGVSINGTTTIYLLICLGLAVDYSAHIGHIFNISAGSGEERAMEAMTRIGPSVFHAVFSTIMAVVVLSMSKSYVFQVFFKVLFLVTFIAGFKGIWLLPVVLSIAGGDKVQEIHCMGTTPANKVVHSAAGEKDEAQGA